MTIQVFVQNEAGSHRKHYHNETTLEYLRSTVVAHAYPVPYGFVIGTTAEDGCGVDCFVLNESEAEDGTGRGV